MTGQTKATLTVQAANSEGQIDRFSNQFSSTLNRELKGDIEVVSPAQFVLESSYKAGDTKTIEGMDTKSFRDVEMTATLIDQATGDVLWTDEGSIQGKGTDSRSALTSALTKYARTVAKKGVASAIDSVRAVYLESCSAQIPRLHVKGTTDQLESRLLATSLMAESDCTDAAASRADELIAELDKRLCDEKIHDLEVRITAGTLRGKAAVNELLLFSPESPCSEKVIELAEVLGSRLDRQSTERLGNYLIIYNVDDAAMRQAKYRQLRWNR